MRERCFSNAWDVFKQNMASGEEAGVDEGNGLFLAVQGLGNSLDNGVRNAGCCHSMSMHPTVGVDQRLGWPSRYLLSMVAFRKPMLSPKACGEAMLLRHPAPSRR